MNECLTLEELEYLRWQPEYTPKLRKYTGIRCQILLYKPETVIYAGYFHTYYPNL